MKNIYIYESISSWNAETPEATIKGYVVNKINGIIEITDENGFTQLINLAKIFAVVY